MKLQGENLENRVQLTESGYLGTISVWVSLHCVDRLRKAIHMDYYHDKIPDYNPDTGIWKKEHSGEYMELSIEARSLHRPPARRHYVPPQQRSLCS